MELHLFIYTSNLKLRSSYKLEIKIHNITDNIIDLFLIFIFETRKEEIRINKEIWYCHGGEYKINVLEDMAPYSLVDRYQSFGRTSCLQLQDQMYHIPPKHWSIYHTTRYHISEDHNLRSQNARNWNKLECRVLVYVYFRTWHLGKIEVLIYMLTTVS
jgi:hypothetical protein